MPAHAPPRPHLPSIAMHGMRVEAVALPWFAAAVHDMRLVGDDYMGADWNLANL